MEVHEIQAPQKENMQIKQMHDLNVSELKRQQQQQEKLTRSLFDKNKALKGVGCLVTYKIYLKDRTQIREKSSW